MVREQLDAISNSSDLSVSRPLDEWGERERDKEREREREIEISKEKAAVDAVLRGTQRSVSGLHDKKEKEGENKRTRKRNRERGSNWMQHPEAVTFSSFAL